MRETLAKSAPPMLDLDGSDHDLTEQNLKQCKGKICDGHYTAAMRVLSSSDLNIDHHPLIASQDVVLDRIKSFPQVLGGGEAILLHAVNHLVKDRRDDVGLSMLLSSATLAMPDYTTESTPCVHAKGCSRAWYLDDGTIVGDTLVIGKVLELITEDGPRCGLHLNVEKTKLFWPKEDPKSRVSKTIGLLDAVAKINDPQCKLLLIRACTGVSKLYFAMRTCPPHVFESAQLSFDMALRSALERIVKASGPGFGDWQWRLATLPFAFGGLGVLRHVGIVASCPTFDDALCVFNKAMEIDFLCNPSDVTALKLMKKMADMYFTRVTKGAESSFSLSRRQMALWQSQR
ncbi:hypothetical protein Tco_0619514 [Tanacetum coccineum]